MPLPIIKPTKLTTAKSDPQQDGSVQTVQQLPCIHNCVKSGTVWTHAFDSFPHACALPEKQSLSPEEIRLKYYNPELLLSSTPGPLQQFQGEESPLVIKQEHEESPNLDCPQDASVIKTEVEESIFNTELLSPTPEATQQFNHEKLPLFSKQEHDEIRLVGRKEHRLIIKAKVDKPTRKVRVAKSDGRGMDRHTSSADDESAARRRRRGQRSKNATRKTTSFSVNKMHDDLLRVKLELADLKRSFEKGFNQMKTMKHEVPANKERVETQAELGINGVEVETEERPFAYPTKGGAEGLLEQNQAFKERHLATIVEFKRHIQGLLDKRKAKGESTETFASRAPQIKLSRSERAKIIAELQAGLETKSKFANDRLEIAELAARNTPNKGVRKAWQEAMQCRQVTEPNTHELDILSGTGFSNAPRDNVYAPATDFWEVSVEQAQDPIPSFSKSMEKRHLHPSFGVGSSNISLNGLHPSSAPTGSRAENWQKYAKLSQASFSNPSTSREEKHTLFNVATVNSPQNGLRIQTSNLRGDNAWFSETWTGLPQSSTPSPTKRKRAIEDVGREGEQKKMTIKDGLEPRTCTWKGRSAGRF